MTPPSVVSRALSANFPSCRTPYSCPFRMSFHSQQLFPPWIFTPNPVLQHPAPSATEDTWFRLGWAGLWHRPCIQLLVLPFTDHPLLWSPEGPFLSQLIPPLWWAFSEFEGPSSIFSILSGLLVPVLIPLFCVTFFILPNYEWIFLVILGFQGLPLMFIKYSVQNYSICRCIFDVYMWGSMDCTSSSSTNLTSPLYYNI